MLAHHYLLTLAVPSPIVSITRSPPDDLLYTTTQLTITCLVEVLQVDNTTAIAVNSAWTSPDSSTDTRNVDTLTNHMLNSALTIPSLQSSDSGTYTCSFSVTSPSAYIEISDPVSASTTIRAGILYEQVYYTSRYIKELYNCMLFNCDHIQCTCNLTL